MDIKRLKKLSGITEEGSQLDYNETLGLSGTSDNDNRPPDEKLLSGLKSVLHQLNSGRPDAARYIINQMIKALEKGVHGTI